MTSIATLAVGLIAVSIVVAAVGYVLVRRSLRPLAVEAMAFRCGVCLYPVPLPWPGEPGRVCSECAGGLSEETVLRPGSGPGQRPRPMTVGLVEGMLIAVGGWGVLGGVQMLVLRSDSWDRCYGEISFGPRLSARPKAVRVLLESGQWRSGGAAEGFLTFRVVSGGGEHAVFTADLATRRVTVSSTPRAAVGTTATPELFGRLFDEHLGEAGSPFRDGQRQALEMMFARAMATPRSFALTNWESLLMWERREGRIFRATSSAMRLGPITLPTTAVLAGNALLFVAMTGAIAFVVAKRVGRAAEADQRAFADAH